MQRHNTGHYNPRPFAGLGAAIARTSATFIGFGLNASQIAALRKRLENQ